MFLQGRIWRLKLLNKYNNIYIYNIELTSDDFKFTTIQFFLALLGSALGGFLIGYAFFFIFMLIYNKKEVLNNSRDLSFREDWDLPKKDKDKGF